MGAVAVWSIWGEGDMFPKASDPKTNTTRPPTAKAAPSPETPNQESTASGGRFSVMLSKSAVNFEHHIHSVQIPRIGLKRKC